MNWGTAIVMSFIIFALFVASLVYVCVSQDIYLVTKNYYEEEIAYQQQIERMKNTKSLQVLPSISIEAGILTLHYPDLPMVSSGSINLFRPSDAELDQKFSITKTDQISQQFRLSGQRKGLYRARFTWQMNNKEYYYEKIIIL